MSPQLDKEFQEKFDKFGCGFYTKIQLMSSLLSFRTWLFCINTMRSKAGVELVDQVNSTIFDFTHNLLVLA